MALLENTVLYLAKYAPVDNCADDESNPVYQKYHSDVYAELCDLFQVVIASRDISDLFRQHERFDYIFSLYNQAPFRNSEILVSAIAEYYRIPYLGARPNTRAIAEDKVLAKVYATHLGLNTPPWKAYDFECLDEISPPDFEPPYFVKPRFAAGSYFIDETSICKTWEAAERQITKIHGESKDALLEKQILGTYYTSPVIDNYSNHLFLPCIREESSLKDGVVSHKQKRKLEVGLERVIENNPSIQALIKDSASRMYNAVKPLDYTRFDFVLDETGTPHFLEFNVCCNLGKHSTLFQAAEHVGFTYRTLLENIVCSSMWRQGMIQDITGKGF